MVSARTGRYIGIARKDESFELVTIAPGGAIGGACFAATAMSAEAIRIYLGDLDGTVGVAVESALMDDALRWGRSTLATTTVVSSRACAADGLARIARHLP